MTLTGITSVSLPAWRRTLHAAGSIQFNGFRMRCIVRLMHVYRRLPRRRGSKTSGGLLTVDREGRLPRGGVGYDAPIVITWADGRRLSRPTGLDPIIDFLGTGPARLFVPGGLGLLKSR